MNKRRLIIILIILLFVLIFFILNSNKNNLNKTSWKLNSWIVSSLDLDSVNITLNFDKKMINGYGGINNYSASYKISMNNRIEFDKFQTTNIASESEKLNRIESNYYNLLMEVKFYEINDNNLMLLDSYKNEVFLFVKQ